MAATGELLREYEPAALRRAVASPGGSTEAGLDALEEHDVREALHAAVDASLERMRGESMPSCSPRSRAMTSPPTSTRSSSSTSS